MKNWKPEELAKIAVGDDFYISPFREDGKTPGTPTWIWSVVVDGQIYVRAYNGTKSRWYRAAMQQKAGEIRAGGMIWNVYFEPEQGPVNDLIDKAYHLKYSDSSYVAAALSVRCRAATVKVIPA